MKVKEFLALCDKDECIDLYIDDPENDKPENYYYAYGHIVGDVRNLFRALNEETLNDEVQDICTRSCDNFDEDLYDSDVAIAINQQKYMERRHDNYAMKEGLKEHIRYLQSELDRLNKENGNEEEDK